MLRPEPVFDFIDLFAGIGGIRRGLEDVGGRCVFTVEFDPHAMRTYNANFPEPGPDGSIRDVPVRDIRTVSSSEVPPYQIIAAGFPCQPFSIAGVSKKLSLGRDHGFGDAKSGNLFFEIMRLVDEAASPPPVLFLENVKNLTAHDGGQTFRVIRANIEGRGYIFRHRVIDAQPWVPQHRERTFMVCIHRDLIDGEGFEFPDVVATAQPTIGDVLDAGVDDRYTLSEHLWDYLVEYANKHRRAGNGFGFGLIGPDDVARTLSARYHKDGSEILFHPDGTNILNRDAAGNWVTRPGVRPRRLTPRECARLMGYPDDFGIPVSDTQAYRQFGNSVVVPVISHLAEALVRQVARAAFRRASPEAQEPSVTTAKAVPAA